MIVARQAIPVLVNREAQYFKSTNMVVEVCKRNGIGELIEKQRMDYTPEQFQVLRKINDFVLWFEKNECGNFRTREETVALLETLTEAIQNGEKLQFIALFCPSYKKEKGAVGFNTEIGNTTKRGIANLSRIKNKANEFGFECEAFAIFSDLALENSHKLTKTDYNDLELNFKDFCRIGENIDSSISFVKLSEIGESMEKIGYNGFKNAKSPLSEKEILHINKRSEQFYKEKLGWKKSDILKRTKELSCSCSAMGRIFSMEFENPIMVMTENIYERGIFYSAELNRKMPTFYPKKYTNAKIAIIGGPLSGKSTLARKLAESLGISYISTGELIREHTEKNDIHIDHFDGKPTFNDDTLIKLITKAIKESGSKGFVLEGFPKYENEFELFKKEWAEIDYLIVLGDNHELSLERSQYRKRSDDEKEIVRHRLEEYAKLKPRIVEFMKPIAKKTIYVNPDYDIEKINSEILEDA